MIRRDKRRLQISLTVDQLAALDAWVKEVDFATRSDLIGELIDAQAAIREHVCIQPRRVGYWDPVQKRVIYEEV